MDGGSRIMRDTMDHIGMLSIPSSSFIILGLTVDLALKECTLESIEVWLMKSGRSYSQMLL